jgi:hypothetical protein
LGPLPDLEGVDWRPRTQETWEAWRLDPATQMWSPADRAYALDAIVLHNQATNPSSVKEVRLRMDGLGLTPKGKRDLRWRVVENQEPAEAVPIGLSRARRRRLLEKTTTGRTGRGRKN